MSKYVMYCAGLSSMSDHCIGKHPLSEETTASEIPGNIRNLSTSLAGLKLKFVIIFYEVANQSF